MSEQPHAIVERDGYVLTITLNRPEARNALSPEMMDIMSATWDEINSNPDIRVAIITGAGGAFCAGADLKAMTRMHPGDSFRQGNAGGLSAGVIKPLLKGFRLTKPLIAAVEGAAIAGGTEILLDDSRRVVARAQDAGVAVELRVYPEMPHVWPAMSAIIPEGRQALDEAAAFLRRAAVRAPEP